MSSYAEKIGKRRVGVTKGMKSFKTCSHLQNFVSRVLVGGSALKPVLKNRVKRG